MLAQDTGRGRSDDALRRMSSLAAVGFGALASVLAATTQGVAPALAATGGVAVAAGLWVLLMAIFVLGPFDARRVAVRAAVARRAAEAQTAETKAVDAPRTLDESPFAEAAAETLPEPTIAATPDRTDPLPITRTEAPVRPVRGKAARRGVAPRVAPARMGGARGLEGALARTHGGVQGATGGPVRLAQPRGGHADDLTLIRGIGPKLSQLLNAQGIWHFDQIASWKARDIADIDAHLGSFRGRITRDAWVKQARLLVAGATEDLSGDVQ